MSKWAWAGFCVVDFVDSTGRQGFELFDHMPGANRFVRNLTETGGRMLRVFDKEGNVVQRGDTE